MPVIALIPVDLARTPLGLPARLAEDFVGKSVLEHTVARVARVAAIHSIVLVHPPGQDPLAVLGNRLFARPVVGFASTAPFEDSHRRYRSAARKWSLTAWRGGLGGATCYDELLAAGGKALEEALRAHKATSALLVGPDWPMVDPDLCARVLALHLENPQGMPMTFCQAPPGLCGLAIAATLIEQIARHRGTIGQLLGYAPSRPQADPIGRDVCVQIEGPIRGCNRRFICDTPRSAAFLRAVAGHLGASLPSADAAAITRAAAAFEPDFGAPLPQQVTLELTARRELTGPITPQHHVRLERSEMPADLAVRLVQQMGAVGDVALTLGGLGDALLYPQWDDIVSAAHAAGVLGIAIETDLLVDRPVLERIVSLPIDVLTIRLSADTAKMYEQSFGADRFRQVVENLQWLITQRNQRVAADQLPGADPLPGAWIVPRLVKTRETLADMESFFDRWMHFAGHAVIEPATTGCGLAPQRSPVMMAPPRRSACRQLAGRMTIHSDGRVAQCDQDWLGRGVLGDASVTPLAELWRNAANLREAHKAGRWGESALCAACSEWHRP